MKRIVRLLKDQLRIELLAISILLIGFSSTNLASEKDNFKSPPTPSLSIELEELISEAANTNKKVDLDLFVMSHCPYGIEAELALLPYVKENQDKVNLNIYYIADEMEDGSFESMHGVAEVDEDIRQLVISKLYPKQFYDYLLQRADNYYNDNWKEPAGNLGIDINLVEQVSSKEETKMLFRNNISLSNMLSVYASPTVHINGEDFGGIIFPIDNSIVSDSIYISKPFGTISGIIADAKSNLPIKSAKVYVSKEKYCITDEKGFYKLNEIPAGYDTLIVRATGYVNNAVRIHIWPGGKQELELKLYQPNPSIKIGINGGIIENAQGVKIIIPPNALEETFEFTLTSLTNNYLIA